jgi:hypothetical protein
MKKLVSIMLVTTLVLSLTTGTATEPTESTVPSPLADRPPVVSKHTGACDTCGVEKSWVITRTPSASRWTGAKRDSAGELLEACVGSFRWVDICSVCRFALCHCPKRLPNPEPILGEIDFGIASYESVIPMFYDDWLDPPYIYVDGERFENKVKREFVAQSAKELYELIEQNELNLSGFGFTSNTDSFDEICFEDNVAIIMYIPRLGIDLFLSVDALLIEDGILTAHTTSFGPCSQRLMSDFRRVVLVVSRNDFNDVSEIHRHNRRHNFCGGCFTPCELHEVWFYDWADSKSILIIKRR